MSKIVIVIADPEQEFYQSLMVSLLEKYDDDTMSLFIATDITFLDARVAEENEIDILLVNEKFYIPGKYRDKIRNTIVITEYPDRVPSNDRAMYVHRYSRQKSLISLIDSLMEEKRNAAQNKKMQARMILVSSVTGGVGKTSIALALTRQLNRHRRPAIYLDAETIQSYYSYIEGKDVMSLSAQKEFIFNDGHLSKRILSEVGCADDIYYIPQLQLPLISFSKNLEIYVNLIKDLKEEGPFQFIIVDTDHVLDAVKAELIDISDRVIMVLDSSRQAADKYARMTECIDFREKCSSVKNRGSGENPQGSRGLEIPVLDGSPGTVVNRMCMTDAFNELVYMIM